jgi:hypothetical protein
MATSYESIVVCLRFRVSEDICRPYDVVEKLAEVLHAHIVMTSTSRSFAVCTSEHASVQEAWLHDNHARTDKCWDFHDTRINSNTG